MPSTTFEQQLYQDVDELRRRSACPAEIVITRWGEPDDVWVSWDVALMVDPENMDSEAEQLYRDLGVLLNQGPYRILEEGSDLDRIGYVVGSEAAQY